MSELGLDFEIDFGQGFQKVAPPRNWSDTVVELIFTNGSANATINATDYEWMGETAIQLQQRKSAALAGGPSLYEGVGLRIYVCESPRQMFFDGYINLASKRAKFECDVFVAPIVETGKVDWLNDVAAGITFFYLRSLPVGAPGRINPATDFKLTPYCITEVPDYTRSAMLAISSLIVLKETIDIVRQTGELINDLIGTASSTGATLGATIGLVVASIANALLYVAYISSMALALINMVNQLIRSIIQLKKSKACMLVRTHFERLCQHLGMNFSSSILADPNSPYYNDTWMPAKNAIMPDQANPLSLFKRPYDESVNFPNNPHVYGHADENARDFILAMEDKYNAKVAIVGNTLRFESTFTGPTPFQIPNQDEPGNTFNLPDPSGTNAEDLPGSYRLSYSLDAIDRTTAQRYQGTSWQVTVRPAAIGNRRRLTYGTAKEIVLPFSHAKRKEYLNGPENILNGIINAVFGFANAVTSLVNGVIGAINFVIGIFGGSGTTLPTIPQLPTNILNNRIGWMELSADDFSNPKCFIGTASGSDWIISSTNEQMNSAWELGTRFHGRNLATRGAQQITYENKTFRLCCKDFNLIKDLNQPYDPLGRRAEFNSLKWIPTKGIAEDASYGVFHIFDSTLQETVIVDGR